MIDQIKEELKKCLEKKDFKSFSIEMKSYIPPPIQPDVYANQQLIKVDGNGTIDFQLNRSFGDTPLVEIGSFHEDNVKESRITAIIDIIIKTDFAAYSVKASDKPHTTNEITIKVNNLIYQISIYSPDPPGLEPVKDLMDILNDSTTGSLFHPLYSYRLALLFNEAKPGEPQKTHFKINKQEVPLKLYFKNRGSQGFWLKHPYRICQSSNPNETCTVYYGLEEVSIDPQKAAPPTSMSAIPLKPAMEDITEMLFVPADSYVSIDFLAEIYIWAAGKYQFMAKYISYEGSNTYEGAPRIRGGVVSNELKVEVK